MMNMDVAFANMAAKKFEDILNQIRSSSLNFHLKVTPFTAVIHLKKSITKDKTGNFLQQSTFANGTNNDNGVDELMTKNLALEQEISDLKISCLKTSESLAEIEKKLELLNRPHENGKNCDENEDKNENEIEEDDGNEDKVGNKNEEENENELANEMTDSGLDFNVSARSTPDEAIKDDSHSHCTKKVHSQKNLIFCNLCQEVFKHKSELKDHKKCEHNPLSEIQCPVCSRTFATDEEHEDHKPCSSCGECGVCFTSDYNYFLHHLQLHQDEFQLGVLPGFTQSYSNSMKQSYANGARCPCAICTKARFKLETKDLTIT